MSYCTVDDVCSEFPRFVRNAPGGVQDTQIQRWLDMAQTRIDGALAQRGIGQFTGGVFTPAIAFTPEQLSWLANANLDAGVGRLGTVLQAQITLQPGEVSIAGQRLKQFEATIQAIRDKKWDAFFGVQSWIRESMGGAETDRSTAQERGENRGFSKNDWPRHM
jgi:hypothetical protein